MRKGGSHLRYDSKYFFSFFAGNAVAFFSGSIAMLSVSGKVKSAGGGCNFCPLKLGTGIKRGEGEVRHVLLYLLLFFLRGHS